MKTTEQFLADALLHGKAKVDSVEREFPETRPIVTKLVVRFMGTEDEYGELAHILLGREPA